MTSHVLDELVSARQPGVAQGVTSICSAHPLVLDEAVRHGARGGYRVLAEATCNQVNQDGGYTGMRPHDFRDDVMARAKRHGLSSDALVLGGDHLGPNPWRGEPVASAMSKARKLVTEFVRAGYTKIHLDASMRCADDPEGPLAQDVIAARTADLAAVAESAVDGSVAAGIRYVIGTEVPVPGGATNNDGGIHVTSATDVVETVALTRAAFESRGVSDAWERVRLVVAQPGVEFSDTELFEYDAVKAKELTDQLAVLPGLAFEAHSTDYQTRDCLRALVTDGFVVLKVGPGLTFAYREGVYGLSYIEDTLLGSHASGIREVLDAAMLRDPSHWQGYYPEDPTAAAFARQFSRSDRSRYYWPQPAVVDALTTMTTNLRKRPIPSELVSQFLPVQYQEFRAGRLNLDPEALLRDKVREVLDDYHWATTPSPTSSS